MNHVAMFAAGIALMGVGLVAWAVIGRHARKGDQ